MVERWLHRMGYDRFQIDQLTMLEIDRMLYAERLATLFANGFTASDLRAVERFRRRRADREASSEGSARALPAPE